MFQVGDRVIARNGMRYRVVRRVGNHPPYLYLVTAGNGKPRIFIHADLRLAAEVEKWLFTDTPWDRVERRKGERRQGKRRGGEHGRAEHLTAERRGATRRLGERRWLDVPSETA